MMATKNHPSYVEVLEPWNAVSKGMSQTHLTRTRKLREQLQEDRNVQRRRASAKQERSDT